MSSPSQRFPLSLVSSWQGSSRFFRFALSRLIEIGGRRKRPRWVVQRVIGSWVSRCGIDLGEFEVPEGGFPTFCDFHGRALRQGARQVDTGSAVVFPADGFVLDHGTIRDGRLTQVKGIDYSMEKLVNETPPRFDLQAFEGGTFVNLYLPMESCHRWYSPLDGELRREKRLPGDRFSLDMRSLASNPSIYASNERLVQELSGPAGELLLVAVGGIAATNVYSTRPPDAPGPVPYAKGQELGGFYLGSSIVILLPRDMAAVALAAHQPIKMGQPLSKTAHP